MLLRKIVQLTLLVLPLVLLAVFAWHRRWLTDDGFIDLRVVDHLLRGNGPVYNIGERVEAYTNALWVALLALWGLAGGRLEIGAVVLGIFFGTGGIGLAQAAAARLWQDPETSVQRPLLPLGALIFVVLPPVWDFTTSGLEMGLAFGWLGLSGWLLTRLTDCHGWPHLTALLIGLGPLIRPDFALFSASFLIAFLFVIHSSSSQLRLQYLVRLVSIALVLPVGYQIFRMGYFAALWPNTLIAKGASESRWSQGLTYLLDFGLPYLLPLPLAFITPLGVQLVKGLYHRRDKAKLAIVGAYVGSALLHGTMVLRVGGDYMHGRLLLPALFTLLLPVAVITLPPVAPTSRRPLLLPLLHLVPIVVWALGCALFARVPYAGAVTTSGISDERGAFTAFAGQNNPVRIDDYSATTVARYGMVLHDWQGDRAVLLQNTEECPAFSDEPQSPTCLAIIAALPSKLPIAVWIAPEIRVVALHHVLGVVSYVAGPQAFIVDRMGLADPIASRLQMPTHGRPGHEKWLTNAWYRARFSTPVVGEETVVTAAREALGCGELAELQDALTSPMTTARFGMNIRQAWAFTHITIPRDPTVAREKFCSNNP